MSRKKDHAKLIRLFKACCVLPNMHKNHYDHEWTTGKGVDSSKGTEQSLVSLLLNKERRERVERWLPDDWDGQIRLLK